MGKPVGSIEIKRGNRVGRPFALYASDGRGNLSRRDYGTASEAQAIAKKLAADTGWKLTDHLAAPSRR